MGVDYYWYQGKNELTYMNSLKMKLSVIMGIAQMSLGIFLKASNAIFFKEKLDFYFEFIPQIILLWSIFGYMVILIIVKWLTVYPDTSTAPAIIAYMIEMFLNFGSISGDALIHSHGLNEALHIFLLLTAFLCVPTMLLVKPYIIYKGMKPHKNDDAYELEDMGGNKNRKQKYQRFDEDEDHNIGMPHEENKHEDPREFKRIQIGSDHSVPVNDALKEKLYS